MNRDPQVMLDGIFPVAMVDKHVPDDRLDLYGMLVQEVHTGVAGRYASCTLQAGDKEIRVHEVTAFIQHASQAYLGWIYHMMTPHPTYQPWAAYLHGAYYPWLQTRIKQDRPIQFPDAFGVGGENAALQTVSIDGVPITCTGKSMVLPRLFVGSGGFGPENTKFWGFQDPPLRIKPYRQLMVQSAAAQGVAQVGMILSVNFIFSEGEFESDVG